MQAKYQWEFRTTDSAVAPQLARELEIPLIIARVLTARGIQSSEQARVFLEPNVKRDLGDPLLFPGIADAVERIWSAVELKEPITIFGDFDVDGVCASVILKKTLDALGAESNVFLPLRESEGYGLTLSAVERCLEGDSVQPKLIITVDCGIGALNEVALLRARGIDVVITDHHECGDQLPDAVAVVNPHCGASPGAEYLCGAGVAYKLAQALVGRARLSGRIIKKTLSGELLVPAGLATVADIVPLKGENRVLAAGAMKFWRRFAGVGLHALMNRGIEKVQNEPNSRTFGFVLGPRINAAGRMDSAMKAFELLMTEDKERARLLAIELEDLNGERKGVQQRILEMARVQCGLQDGCCDADAIVVGDMTKNATADEAGWHPGVAGIVASQLCDESGKPVAVIVFDEDGSGRGSTRAGRNYHALNALAECSEALSGFGGHARAAGFQLNPGMFERFKELFCAACARQSGDLRAGASLTVEEWLEPEHISCEVLGNIQKLAPFGHENNEPRWALRAVEVVQRRVIGRNKDHMQFSVRLDEQKTVRAVWFKCGDLSQCVAPGDRVDLVFEMEPNDYHGKTEIELRILDMRTAEV